MFAAEACLLGPELLTTSVLPRAIHDEATVSILALAMGMRTVTVQRLGISGVSTTVVTTMLAMLAGQDLRARVKWDEDRLRVAAIAAMLLGAGRVHVHVRTSSTKPQRR